jgi:hypothetical protein
MAATDYTAITIDRPAASALSGHRCVRVVDGEASYCDAADASHIGQAIGITNGAASQGNDAAIVTHGPLSEIGWNWSPGPVYCGADGALTQSTTGLAFVQQVAIAEGANDIFVSIHPAIKRA